MDFYDIKLGDCLSMIENGATIKQQKGSKGLPITRIETLSNNRFNRDRLGYADIFDANKYSHYILDDKDILMSHINSKAFLGRSVLYKRHGNEQIIHGMNVLRIKTKKDVLDQEYAYYYFQTSFFKKNIHNIRKDAVNQSSINISDIKDIIIQIPSLKDQKNIVTVLSNIDCKIALNRQINDNLEAMARQLYDYWFVQFDFPNEKDKPYKSSGGKMVWNEKLKREIPQWVDAKKIGDIENNIITGKTPSCADEDNFGGDIPFVTIDDIRDNLFVFEAQRTLSIKGADSQEKKYLPIGSLSVSCIGTIGIMGFVARLAQTNQQINSIVFEHDYNKEFLYFSLRLYFENAKAKTGNVFANMSKEEFASIIVTYPPMQTLQAFHNKVAPIFDSIKNNIEEINTLTRQRDELLPLLMNGQASVNYHLSLAHITPTTLAPLCTP